MSIKKFLLLAGFSALAASAIAQDAQPKEGTTTTPAAGAPQYSARDMTYRGKNYDVLDSSYYSKKQLKQYRQYMDHQSVFPPKPRNQFEVGFGMGMYNVIGDVPSLNFFQKGGGGLHLHVRKSLGYAFSARVQYIYGVGKNLDVQPTQTYDAPYTNKGYVPGFYATPATPAQNVYRSTRMESSQLNLDLIYHFNNISFHQARNTMSFYGYLGLGALGYKTRVNALDADETAYNFNTLVPDPKKSNKDIRKDLQSKMDKTYESAADNGKSKTILDKKTLDFAPSVGLGVQYKLNKKFNIQIEDRYTFPSDDYLDGTRFGTSLPGGAASVSQGSDGINYFSVGVNYNVQTKKKSVEPLYWMNPLDHGYSELSYPRHMLLPAPVLPDEDNDGITDQFDKCPKTPAATATDAKGCPMDTDGDGVPDYKDKQLITPTECQPVDADGVGHCTCPEDCLTGGRIGNKNCPHIKDGSLSFKGNSTITPEIKTKLATLASQMRLDADCKAVIMGGGSGSKVKEQRAWERVNAVIEYMTEKENIMRDRFIFQYGVAGEDENIVIYRSAGADDSGPSAPPPPHPNLK